MSLVTFISQREAVQHITAVLKKRFTNLTAEEIISLSYDILEGLKLKQVDE